MPLHDAFASLFDTRWKWYAAFVERTGRQHLLQVPVIQLRPADLVPPSYMQTPPNATDAVREHYLARITRWTQQMCRAPVAPSQITTEMAVRYCDTPQRAEMYTVYGQPQHHQRGVCAPCMEHWLTYDEEYRRLHTRQEGRVTTSRTPEQWAEGIRLAYTSGR